MNHAVVCIPTKQILANVIDVLKQGLGISFTTYRKLKQFGEQGKNSVLLHVHTEI